MTASGHLATDPGAGAARRAVPDRVAGAVVVAAALVLTVWRAPQYVIAPSFWAEDGLFFFAGAWNRGSLFGLLQHPSGYLQLYANLASSLAAWLVGAGLVSLAAAPRVTALAALAAQMLPIVLVVSAAAPAWGGLARRAAAVAIVLFGARTGGIWLNTTNSQYFLALAAVVVLLEPTALGPARRRVHAVVVGLAALAGPVASFLTPLFVWKAWRMRARSAILLATVSAAGAAVQLACLLAGGAGTLAGRGLAPSMPVFATVVWLRTVLLPVLGSEPVLDVAHRLTPVLAVAGAPFAGGLLGMLALGVVVVAFGAPRDVRWRLAAAYALVTAGSFAGAIGDLRTMLGNVEGGARYAFVPSVLVLWLLLFNVRRPRSARSLVCAAVLAVGVGSSAWHWRETVRWKPSWPVWVDQVTAWQRDPKAPLHIWPRGWTMILVPRKP